GSPVADRAMVAGGEPIAVVVTSSVADVPALTVCSSGDTPSAKFPVELAPKRHLPSRADHWVWTRNVSRLAVPAHASDSSAIRGSYQASGAARSLPAKPTAGSVTACAISCDATQVVASRSRPAPQLPAQPMAPTSGMTT